MIENGTRQRQGKYHERPETRFPNGKYRTDLGLSKRVICSATFTASDSKLTDAAADFTDFAVNDEVIIWNSASNNGVRRVLAVETTALTFDFPVKDEGPTAGVEVRMT